MGLFSGEARSKLNESPQLEYYWVMNNSIACRVKLAQWRESIMRNSRAGKAPCCDTGWNE